ncbi:MAG: glycosyltransferase [Luteitalea sp.]|nr:glycosyltransferase [Luteitalea sp.]
MPRVSFGIVTWNSAEVIAGSVASVRQQGGVAAELLVWDNGSGDETRAHLDVLTRPDERIYADINVGFAAAHNALIARSRSEYYIALNPDVVLAPSFTAEIVAALEADPQAGSATGKLLRIDNPQILDSTGIRMLPSQRHVDRGADTVDAGQYDRLEYVFGASGAAACYRRHMLEDARIGREYFDEDFFAFREDADLAWRAQLLGWRCVYVPAARAWHGRRVTPARRPRLPAAINRASVRNRFLLRLKNQTWGHALTFAAPGLWRDAQVIGYVLAREHTSIPGLVDVVRYLPRALAKRRTIMRRRRVADEEIIAWFRQA